MDKHQDGDHNRDNSTLIERQIAYSLNRLATVVNELSRLTGTGPAGSIELVRAEIDTRAELTSAGIEAAHQLRMWRAHYTWLTSELDAASRSFGQAAQQLGQLVDTALASWEEQFEVVRPSGRIGPAAVRAARACCAGCSGGARPRYRCPAPGTASQRAGRDWPLAYGRPRRPCGCPRLAGRTVRRRGQRVRPGLG